MVNKAYQCCETQPRACGLRHAYTGTFLFPYKNTAYSAASSSLTYTAADTESSTMTQEYCEDETFTATCGNQQVVVMETARCVIITASVQLNTPLKRVISYCPLT